MKQFKIAYGPEAKKYFELPVNWYRSGRLIIQMLLQ